jgi:hypothetical protein
MARRHGSSKNSGSSAGFSETSSPTHEREPSQMDGACFGKPDAPEPEPEPEIPAMPMFLQLTPEGMKPKPCLLRPRY